MDPTVSGSDQLQAYWFRIRPGMDPHRLRFPRTVNIPLFGLRLDQQKVSRKYYISGGGGLHSACAPSAGKAKQNVCDLHYTGGGMSVRLSKNLNNHSFY